MKYRIILFLFIAPLTLMGQFLNRSEVSIVENGSIIKNPLTGGLNSCQLSNIDMNNDGKKDIFVFERIGDRNVCFLNNNDGVGSNFAYSKDYSNAFPKLKKWALLVDYNCDGKEDIFTYNDSYVRVYKNTSEGENLSLEIETSAIVSDLGPILSAIIISEVDIPSFVDVDGDNDIDVLTFKQSGGYVEYHQNQSQELYGNCDSLVFELKTDCWGEFFEGLNTYDFNSCNENTMTNTAEPRSSGAHSGSSSLALDMDGDNDMDFILGDVSFNNLNLLINGGDAQNATMVSANQDFPLGNGSDVSAEINSFPAAFYLDINNDNIRDLVVSPNIDNNAENFESVMAFLNTGTDNNPNFEFSQKNFLQDNTLDFGSGAYPTLIDYNNDGLKDILIGNYGYFNNNNPSSQLALLRNIGSQTEPNFELIDRDFGGLSSIALDTILNETANGLYPAIADLDDDGDVDMILGDNNGKIHYFKNSAGAGQDAVFELENVNFYSIDIGQHSAPFLYDMNGDSLYDLVIGQVDGSLSYAENTGTSNTPIFNTLIDDFGGVNVNNDESLYGFSTPFIYEQDGEINILVGCESGKIYHYRSVNNNLSANFELISNNFKGISEGKNTALLFEDFTGDGKRDLFLGMQTGGLFYYLNENEGINILQSMNDLSVEVFPNPTKDYITITADGELDVSMYSTLGMLVLEQKIDGYTRIDMRHLSSSYYFMHIQQGNNSSWKKIFRQ
ncbi:T9SS type A sorting domain-containing protein [Flavobacteriales bacterium]|nr:T9SS type A sorting domain-containing protein [Flavobacteriales bacterium]